MHSLDEIGDIDAEAFCKFAKNHNALLFPAFEMQTALQRSTLGTAFWQRNSERRIEISKGRFVPIGKLMELVRLVNDDHLLSSKLHHGYYST
jgi:hypothetical protein